MNEEESVLGLLHKNMQDEKENFVAVILQGAAPDYAHYKELCGKIYGLSLAQRIINETVERLQKQRQ